ncbi:heme-binding-like protein, chloroplastic [Artemisia annua]|uniref:Heme-binding-like protein, chloroplastic n=1 Tax=Artemisia annua TaxID=35608 RepID=A0A2U1LGI7_ARTAN|nr:heme-binding-like protein, chloroplastic [Artemisia annua]
MGNRLGIVGMVFGKIIVETPKYEVIKSTTDYEIRHYPPSVIAEITYDPAQMKGQDKDGGFSILANYIGVLGKPQNTTTQKIDMTSPVITKKPEKIDMTSPVITQDHASDEGKVTMQFILPEKYKKAEEAPKPVDERVVIKEEGGRKYGVVKFSGIATNDVVSQKVEKMKKDLERDGVKIVGEYVLARYNPPWTLPPFRTNEIMIPVE